MIHIDISPIAFTIGPLAVRWYGIMVALAVLTLVVWALWAARKGGRISHDTVITAALVGIPSGIVFSRFLHVFDNIVVAKFHPDLVLSGAVFDYTQHPAEIFTHFGEGLTIWGAVLGAALGVWIYSRFSKLAFGYFADVIAPGIILAQAIGRVGCTLNGCCYGVETSCCGVIYSNPESLAPLGVAVYPTQIFEIGYNLIVFVVLLLLRNRFRPDGSLFAIYLTLYSIWRFGIDFIRDGTPFLFGLHEAQVISLVVMIVCVVWMALKTRWVKGTKED